MFDLGRDREPLVLVEWKRNKAKADCYQFILYEFSDSYFRIKPSSFVWFTEDSRKKPYNCCSLGKY